jgi:hypothetical protein
LASLSLVNLTLLGAYRCPVDEEFEDSDVMDTPLRKAMRDAGMKESDFR